MRSVYLAMSEVPSCLGPVDPPAHTTSDANRGSTLRPGIFIVLIHSADQSVVFTNAQRVPRSSKGATADLGCGGGAAGKEPPNGAAPRRSGPGRCGRRR